MLNANVIISCAVTGAGDTVGKHPAIPVTPRQIADSALEAHEAGAAIVHLHVRDPETGKAARDPALYRETVGLIRSSGADVVINLTAGMGGDFFFDPAHPASGGPGTDMAGAAERVAHVEELRPEICTLDCGSLNFGNGAFFATADLLREMARRIQAAGVKPEIECFELGHVWLAKQLIAEGLIDPPPLFQLCLGIPWGAEATTEAMLAMRGHLPAGANWAGFAIGRYADGLCRPGGFARRPCAGRARGQPLARPRRAGEQRRAGQARAGNRRAHGRFHRHPRRGARQAWPQKAEMKDAPAHREDRMAKPIERVAVVGAGVIGSGWAARFLGAGLDVAAWDPGA